MLKAVPRILFTDDTVRNTFRYLIKQEWKIKRLDKQNKNQKHFLFRMTLQHTPGTRQYKGF